MDWQIPDNERKHLRELAKKQAQYAALPVMARRKQMWFDLNDGRPGTRRHTGLGVTGRRNAIITR